MTDMTVGNVMSVKITGQTAKSRKTTDTMEEFAGIMSQSQQSFLNAAANEFSADKKNNQELFSIGSIDITQSDYGKLSTGNRQIARGSDSDQSSSVNADQVQDLARRVEDTVKETMQVDDGELEEAMDDLGLTEEDLLQPQNLIQLLQSLTGAEDVSGLLMNEGIQSTLQNVNELLTAFQQNNGLDQAGFEDLLAQLSQNIDDMAEAVEDLLDAAEGIPEEALFDEPVDESGLSQAQDPFASVIASQENLTKAEGTQEVRQNASADNQEISLSQTMTSTQEAVSGAEKSEESGGQQLAGGNSWDQKTGTTGEGAQDNFTEAFVSAPTEATPELNVPTELSQAQGLNGYEQLQNLMDQMEGLARTFASSEGTTVEMQLNPENLGRLTLSVSEKQGNVTAQIIASNEQVKEVLQTQLVELRSTLLNQGVRVQAVEVTVASHEFEQNLDGNTSAEQQNGEAPEREMHQRRNLNLNNLDELSGLMSEEETLAATMMRDNGGSVDYTA